MKTPLLVIIAGPNGAGKSTAAATLLPSDMAFVNADEIAKTLENYPSRSADLEAGRIALEQMDQLERSRSDFAVETTLAGRSLATRAVRLRSLGYFFRLIFIWSPGPDFSIRRVAHRVRLGGHHIPEDTIRRRYDAGLRNFFELYRPQADAWEMYENSSTKGFTIIASGVAGILTNIYDSDLWSRILEGGHDE